MGIKMYNEPVVAEHVNATVMTDMTCARAAGYMTDFGTKDGERQEDSSSGQEGTYDLRSPLPLPAACFISPSFSSSTFSTSFATRSSR